MNSVAHVEVAAAVHPEPPDDGRPVDLLLGAALPDLAAIAGVRLRADRPDGPLARGIDLHHAADTVFHADPAVRRLMSGLRGELRRRGLSRGAVRACGHVGVELLLDGALLARDEVAARTAAVRAQLADPPAAVVELVDGPARAQWSQALRAIGQRVDPMRYGDPVAVSEMLERTLSRRPRLAFASAHRPQVEAALRWMQPEIVAASEDVLIATVSGVQVAADPGMLGR